MQTTYHQAWTDGDTGTIVILQGGKDFYDARDNRTTFECRATWVFPSGKVVHDADTQVGPDRIVRLYHYGPHDEVRL